MASTKAANAAQVLVAWSDTRAMRKSRSERAIASFFVVLSAACAVAGCGSTSRFGLTHSELVAQADAICASAIRRTAERRVPAGSSVPVDYETLLDETSSILAPMVRQLAQLVPPPSDAAEYRRFVQGGEEVVGAFTRQAVALHHDDLAGAENVFNGLKPTQPTAIAARLGITDCARGSSLPPASLFDRWVRRLR